MARQHDADLTLRQKKVVLITTGQPSTNPRVVKEADALYTDGHDVLVIYSFWANWASKSDQALLKGRSWKSIQVGGDPFENKWEYFVSRVVQKIARALAKYLKGIGFEEHAWSRNFYFLKREASRVKADLYIAHNLGALPVAFHAAQKHNAKFGFDAEDFHRGEIINRFSLTFKLACYLEDKYIGKCHYFSAASPLIADQYKLLFPSLEPVSVLNAFPLNDFVFKQLQIDNEKISLIWFSQSISFGRGIELILPSVYERRDRFQLTLIGGLDKDFYEKFLKQYASCLVIQQPMTQTVLNAEICSHDVGLALELLDSNYNRQICLTNKILAYYQAGLYILATNTPAQVSFINDNPQHGLIAECSGESMNKILSEVSDKIEAIRRHKHDRFLSAQKYSWESESQKLKKVWDEVMS